MTLQRTHHRNEHGTDTRRPIVDHIIWEPRLPPTRLRRTSWEQATVVEVSVNGALVRARANDSITRDTRISIGVGNARGLAAVRCVEPAADEAMSHYVIQFLWLDPKMQRLFDDAVSTDIPLNFERR